MDIELDFIVNYAVSFTAKLVSLYSYNGFEWVFVRNGTFANALQVHSLEVLYVSDDISLMVFPCGLNPNKIPSLQKELLE